MATYRFDKPIKSYVERMEKQGRQAQEEYNKLASEIEALQNEGWQWKDSKTMSGYQDRLYSLSQKLNGYNSFLEQYGESLYGEGGKSALSLISEASKSANTMRDIVDFYSGQFKKGTNAETYARAKAKDDEKIAKLSAFEDLRNTEDFGEKSKYDRWRANTLKGVTGGNFIESVKGNSLYDKLNQIGDESESRDAVQSFLSNISLTGDARYQNITSDELALYNYIYNTEGPAKANEYFGLIEDTINYRRGKEIADSWIGKTPVIRLGASFASGVDSSVQGIINAVNSVVNPNQDRATSVMQYAGGLIQQDAARDSWISKYAVAIAQSIGQMMPSIAAAMTGGLAGGSSIAAIKGAADTLSKVASMGVLGTSVYGNSYNEAVQRGNTGWNAYGYGLVSAGIEVVAESLFDKMPGLKSGELVSKLGKIGKTLDNIGDVLGGSSIARIAASGAQEGLEEVFSGILSPIIESAFLGEDFEIDGGELLESFMIGALTSGVMNTPGEISKSRYYSGLTDRINSGATEATFGDIRSSAQLLGEESTSKKLSDKMAAIESEGKQVSRGRQKNLLRNFMEESAGISDSEAAESIKAYKKAHGIKNGVELTEAQLDEVAQIASSRKNAVTPASAETQQRRGLENEKSKKRAEAEQELAKFKPRAGEFSVSDSGKVIKNDGAEVDFSAFTSKVEVSKNGEITFTSEDGDSFSTADTQLPYRVAVASEFAASGYIPKAGLSAYFSNLPEGASTEAEILDYAIDFREAYNAGIEGEGYTSTVSADSFSKIGSSVRGAIYEAGLEERKAIKRELGEQINQAKDALKAKGKTTFRRGKLDDSKIKNISLSKAQMMAVDVAKAFTALGLNVEFYASTLEERTSKDASKRKPNGFFESDTGTLYFDINAGFNESALGSGLFWTMAHEVTHALKKAAPEAYDTLRTYVLDTLFTEQGALDAAVKEEQDTYREAHPNEKEMDRETAIDEIVARACEDIFTHSESLVKLLRECDAKKAGFAKRLFDSVKAFIERLSAFLKGLSHLYDSGSAEAKAFRASEEKIKKLSELWESAFREASENFGVVYGEKVTSQPSEKVNTLSENSKKYFSGRGNGYDGYSMSNNARAAYQSGERPMSKWSKSEIIDEVYEINPDIDISKINLDTLKKKFLERSSWHHTSMYYNKTDFYSLKEDYISKLSQKDVDDIVSTQVSRKTIKRDIELDKMVDEAYRKVLTIVEAGILKTENSAIKRLLSDRGIEDVYQKAVEIIKKRDISKVNHWRSLPKNHFRQTHVKLYDTNIEDYIAEVYANKKISKNSNVFKQISAYLAKEESSKNTYFSDRRGNRDREILREVIANSNLRGNYTDKAGELMKYKNAQESYDKALGKISEIQGQIEDILSRETNSRAAYFKKNTYIKANKVGTKYLQINKTDMNSFINALSDVFDIPYKRKGMLKGKIEALYEEWNLNKKLLAEDAFKEAVELYGEFFKEGNSLLNSYEAQEFAAALIDEYQNIGNIVKDTVKVSEDLDAARATGRKRLSKAKGIIRDLNSRYAVLETYYSRLIAAEEKMFTYEAEGLRSVIDSELSLRAKEAVKARNEEIKRQRSEKRQKAQQAEEVAKVSVRVKKILGLLNEKDGAKRVPDALRGAIETFLDEINLTKVIRRDGELVITKKSQYLEEKKEKSISGNTMSFEEVVEAYKEIATNDAASTEETDYFGVNEDVIRHLEEANRAITAAVAVAPGGNIYRMDIEGLSALREALDIIYTTVRNANEYVTSGMSIAAHAKETQSEAEGKKPVKWSKSVLNILTPAYFFERMGKSAVKIYDMLRMGEMRMGRYFEDYREFCRKNITPSDVTNWENETHEFTLTTLGKISEGLKKRKVHMTTAQMMSIYCSYKRDDARKHMIPQTDSKGNLKKAGGIRLTESGKKIKAGEDTAVAGDQIFLTDEDARAIFAELTDNQKKVADATQEYMSTVEAEWGNLVSMKRFGIMQFVDKNYFPMKTVASDGEISEKEAKQSMTALLNKSFTKSLTEGANNSLYIDSIFNVFAKHSADMIQYSSLALPLLDAVHWFNFNSNEELDNGAKAEINIKSMLTRAYGKHSVEYIRNLIKQMNGSISGVSGGGEIQKLLLKNTKAALVGGKVKQVVLQPLSIMRAGSVINPKHLATAIGKSVDIRKVKELYDEAAQYSAAAKMKRAGFRETGVSTSTSDILRGTNELLFKEIFQMDGVSDKVKASYRTLQNLGFKYMEIGDVYGWSVLWNASLSEALSRDKKLVPGSKEHKEAAGRIMDDACYKTQVFDSLLAKPPVIRNTQNSLLSLSTAFMGEPMATVQPLLASALAIKDDMAQNGLSFGQALKKDGGKVARDLLVFTLSGAAMAAFNTLMSAIDGEDEDEFDPERLGKEFLKNFFFDEMNPLTKIPYVNEIWDIAVYGYDPSRLDLEGVSSIVQGTRRLYRELFGAGKLTAYGFIKTASEMVSLITGIPFENFINDIGDTISILIGEEITEKQ